MSSALIHTRVNSDRFIWREREREALPEGGTSGSGLALNVFQEGKKPSVERGACCESLSAAELL